MKKKELLSILLSLLLLSLLLAAASWAFLPKIYSSGLDWSRYRLEAENSVDVLFAGSSMVYCDVAPGAVYARSGVTGYLVSGPEQTVPMAYYIVREACRTQTPKAVFLEMHSMFMGPDEQYAPENVLLMPLGRNRLEAVFHTVERQDIPGLLLPVLAYHDRWIDLSPGELRERLRPEIDLYAGYMLYTDSEPQGAPAPRELSADCCGAALDYLGRLADYCAERGIALYLYLAPSCAPLSAAAVEKLEADVEGLGCAAFVNFNSEENLKRLALDPERDWLDYLHLNLYGAQKFSAALGDYLLEQGFAPSANADAGLWQQRATIVEG